MLIIHHFEKDELGTRILAVLGGGLATEYMYSISGGWSPPALQRDCLRQTAKLFPLWADRDIIGEGRGMICRARIFKTEVEKKVSMKAVGRWVSPELEEVLQVRKRVVVPLAYESLPESPY